MNFTLPDWVQKHWFDYDGVDGVSDEFYVALKSKLEKFQCDDPLVSIVVPAWNEELNILRTISSFADIETSHKTELLFINNNSTDRTQEILDRCGIRSIFEPKQGVNNARQTGLYSAKGKFHLCADSDSIYPAGWVDAYVNVLSDESVSCAYGRHAFIPPDISSRFSLAMYELFTSPILYMRSKNRVHLNVLGMNFGFRTADGIKVGGFDYDKKVWEDGWMALKLKSLGRVVKVPGDDGVNWTTARRLLDDGTVWGAFKRRIKNEIRRFPGYFKKNRKD
ncbi:MAG: glycosyltransferase [Chlorobi bacterium OLB4]|jgi:Glycosyltransferases, probably involved in cell wall biogenesis|nr:MAG: glycosyltransferase [Chlorobi bacterium OLB4]MBW7855878.1 glycosyltransferase family 2 protein [Ignavibacteria bacterium]OQY76614.1 MAG: hypothetical protein B6D43_10585 [Ignavibacteriales bacterium UTCHB1]